MPEFQNNTFDDEYFIDSSDSSNKNKDSKHKNHKNDDESNNKKKTHKDKKSKEADSTSDNEIVYIKDKKKIKVDLSHIINKDTNILNNYLLSESCDNNYEYKNNKTSNLVSPLKIHIIKNKCSEPGKKGKRGEKGEPGKRGKRGEKGEPGKKGERGKRGKKGEDGKRGKHGKRGKRGKMGPPGLPCLIDQTNCITDKYCNEHITKYLYYYNTSLRDIQPNGVVEFDYSLINTPSNLYSNGNIILENPGHYKVSYFTHTLQSSQFALFLNNIYQPETTFNTSYGATIILTTIPNSTLSLINTTNDIINLEMLNNNGNNIGINAYIIIEKLD
jgi:hypothetical protein